MRQLFTISSDINDRATQRMCIITHKGNHTQMIGLKSFLDDFAVWELNEKFLLFNLNVKRINRVSHQRELMN